MNRVTILKDAALRELASYLSKSESETIEAILTAFDRHGVLSQDDVPFCGMNIGELSGYIDYSIAPLNLICWGKSNPELNRMLKSLTIWGESDEDETCPDCGCGIDWDKSDYEESTNYDRHMISPPESSRLVTYFVCSNSDCPGSNFNQLAKILKP